MISLCIIAGNVERYITRFLECFAPLVQEIVVVRACGSQEADRTLDFVDVFRGKVSIPIRTAVYENAPTHADWPHVDDYAAARNMAFSLASPDHEWLAWFDTDDVIDADSVTSITAAFHRYKDDFDAFAVDYLVPEDGLRVQKERIIRRGSGEWRYPIHEEFKFHADHPRVIRVADALVTHMPSGSRAPNDERNLRILRSMTREQMTLGHRFHLVTSLAACGEEVASREEAVRLLREPELGKDERFELLMNLAEKCEDKATQGNFYLHALGVCPDRREAYGELAIWSMMTCRFQHALAFSRAMMGIPRPKEYLWNARSMYYGWFGLNIHAMALRVNGRQRQADVLQFNHFREHGGKISLLHATRGRGRRAYRAKHEWLSRAADPDAIEHIYAIDSDDADSIALAAQQCVIVPPGGGCVRAWNAAAAMSHGQVLVQMSDDWVPPVHWDRMILERIGDPAVPAVLAISDGSRADDLLCMAILTRARYQQQGWLFHPDFEAAAMFSDNYFTDRAYRDGVVIEARDIVFEHQHPAFGKGQMDATYAAQNAPEKYQKGKEIFDRLTA